MSAPLSGQRRCGRTALGKVALAPVSPRDYIHPLDEAAHANLEAIPGFSSALKAFLKIGVEQYLHGLNLATKIRLSERQLPEIHARLRPICERLGIAVPDLYLEMNPSPNAYTCGDTRIFITLTSGLLEYLDDAEIDAVLAHECGHIACHHVLYHTMAQLLRLGVGSIGFLDLAMEPIKEGLAHWSRCSELSADRAAAIVCGKPDPVVRTMIRLAGGPRSITQGIDVSEYARQAEEYEALASSGWNKFLQNLASRNESHPFASIRTREIIAWCASDPFGQVQRNLERIEAGVACPQCGRSIEPGWKFCKGCGRGL